MLGRVAGECSIGAGLGKLLQGTPFLGRRNETVYDNIQRNITSVSLTR